MKTIEEDREDFDVEFYHLLPIAKLYKISLDDARDKHRNHGEFGADEGDIKLDMVSLIHTWQITPRLIEKSQMEPYIKDELDNWGYEKEEVEKVMKTVRTN